MSKKIILCQWIPASWKSTWTKEQKGFMSISKDQIRENLHWGVYSKENELEVIEAERNFVRGAMGLWLDVIVDNTHLLNKFTRKNKHIEYYRELAKEYWYELEVKVFHISIEDAIKRDAEREKPVGEDVIRKMSKYSVIPGDKPQNPTFRKIDHDKWIAIICDIDWTIAFMNWKRSPYDYSKVGGDDLNDPLQWLLYAILSNNPGVKLFFLSGRKTECRAETLAWLTSKWFGVSEDELIMRADWDNRCDSIVKRELFEKNIEKDYNVLAVFDDRDRVVDMWRELNLPTYQVWYWWF